MLGSVARKVVAAAERVRGVLAQASGIPGFRVDRVYVGKIGL